MKIVLLFLLTLFPQFCCSQLAFHADLGIGGIGGVVMTGGGIGVGTLVKKNFLFSGGIKFSKFILDSYDKKEKTNSIYETDLLLGARYSFAVLDFGEQAQIEQLGLFVEGRGYFCPYIQDDLMYTNDQDEKVYVHGKYTTQFGYGLGGGLFLGSVGKGYFAIRYDMCTIDPFAKVRTFEETKDEFTFPTGVQHIVSLSVYFN
ncbi:MAG: hypothetical protein KBG80_08895 [Breznakibacter sp.]|nr:hypothetical protein [Breznakibacter sp.]